MENLVQWLLAQLDEDERIARATTERQPYDEWDAVGAGDHDDAARSHWEVVKIAHMNPTPAARLLALHIARHDPARVLREVDAKRRILEIHHVIGGWEDEDGQDIGLGCNECGYSAEYSDRGGWCDTVRLLALPYADRPGYREEWRP